MLLFYGMQGTEAQLESFEEKTHQTGFVAMLDALSFTIDRISCEVKANDDYKIF
jgi:hypothetical protein